MPCYVGIDLGTTESTLSIINIERRTDDPHEKLRSIPIYQYNKMHTYERDLTTLQSAIYINRDTKKVYTGDYAKEMYSSGNSPLNTIRSIKTRIGGESMITVPLKEDKTNTANYSITELSALLLKTMMNSLEKQIDPNTIKNITITIPAAFNSDERRATVDAAHMAGMKNVHLLDEPTAVLLNFLNLEEPLLADDFFDTPKKVLVYDLGGGTLDISIAQVENIADESDYTVDILGRSQRMDFGGDDIDKYIAAYFLEEFEKINPSIESRSLEDQAKIISRIVTHAEKHKIALHEQIDPVIDNPRRRDKTKELVNFEIIDNLSITDVTLSDALIKDILQPVINDNGNLLLPIEKSLRQNNIKKEDIDLVVLTGGSCKFYLVQEVLRSYFGRIPMIPFTASNAVSVGAAIFSHTVDNEDFKTIAIKDSLSDSIFIKHGNSYECLIPNSTPAGSKGVFMYEFKRTTKKIELFLYYGLGEDIDKPYKLKEITGVFYELDDWHEKDKTIELHWELDENKIIKVFYDGEILLSTNNRSHSESLLLKYFTINE